MLLNLGLNQYKRYTMQPVTNKGFKQNKALILLLLADYLTLKPGSTRVNLKYL